MSKKIASFVSVLSCNEAPRKHFSINGVVTCKRGHVAAVLDNWGKSFTISFDINLSGAYTSTTHWRNLFVISSSGSRSGIGARFPSVFAVKNALLISSFVGTSSQYVDYRFELENKKDYHIEITQKINVHLAFILMCIKSNGVLEYCWFIKTPTIFEKVFVYTSGPHDNNWYSTMGTFKNLKISSH